MLSERYMRRGPRWRNNLGLEPLAKRAVPYRNGEAYLQMVLKEPVENLPVLQQHHHHHLFFHRRRLLHFLLLHFLYFHFLLQGTVAEGALEMEEVVHGWITTIPTRHYY